jgi:hypothetical protein
MTAETDEVLAPAEVAKILKLPIATIREGLRRGVIPGCLIMRRWRTKRSDLVALLSVRPAAPSPTAPTRPVPTVTSAPPLGRPGRPRKRRLRDRTTN